MSPILSLRWALLVARLGALLVASRAAQASVVQAPEGGRPIPIVARGAVCGPLDGGWAVDPSDRRYVIPPAAGAANLARSLEVKISDGADCTHSDRTLTLVALGAWPDLDATGVTFFPDEGRIEIKGQRLRGLQIGWTAPTEDKQPPREGSDACLDPIPNKPCAIPVPSGLPAGVALSWAPAYGRFGSDVVTFDAFGNRVDGEALRLRPSRVVLTKPLVQTSGVEVTSGPARVVLTHPEAVASVDCGAASCELGERGVLVQALPGPASSITLRLRLVPRVFAAHGDALEPVVTVAVPILPCPMAVVPGTVVRDVAETSAVVKLDPRCGRDPVNLRWTAGGDSAEVRKVVKADDGVYVLLHLGQITAEKLTVTAARPDLGGTIVASASGKTLAVPTPRVALELRGHGKIDFVPTNRPAALLVSSAGEAGSFVPVPVTGAYEVVSDGGGLAIRAEEGAEGYTSLRLGYRVKSLPGELATTDLLVLTEHTQRSVREAAVPAPIGASAYASAGEALVELVCGDGSGGSQRVVPGQPYRIPYALRDSCRVILHRERLTAADGSQEITLDIDVTKADGTPRPEAKLSEHMVLHPGAEARVIAVKGGLVEFDRVQVRVSHVIDESRYVVSAAAPTRPGLLAAQWNAIVDGGRLRLYATATIPAGLYRVNHPSGQLTLNFGVLSRLTTLNREGKEGLFGLEIGVMGLGLAPQQSNVEFPVTLAVVSGLGFRVPLGQGATIGIQAWVAYEFRDGPIRVLNADGTTTNQSAGPWSFIFGPSISFGNVGMNL